MGTKVYFFSDNRCIQYDRGSDRVDGRPLLLASFASDMGKVGFGGGFDTAINWGNGKVYFFKGPDYVRYDIPKGRIDEGYPLKIADQWPGMSDAGFDSDLDAAVNWDNGKVYFFKKDQFVRYDIAKDKVDSGYPLSIADFWPGMAAAGFASDLDAAINWGSGKAYFFMGNRYVRYDIAADAVDEGYPLFIANQWPGMGDAGFAAGLTGAIDLLDLTREIWLTGVIRKPGTLSGPAYLPVPWRGVLHTTEGDTLSGALATLDTNRDWPHLTIDPATQTIVQQMPLNRGARALSDKATLENAARAAQIEIVGRAANSPELGATELGFIRNVMRQIEDVVPIPRMTDRTFLDQAGVASTPANRLSVAQWKVFSGWCGHQHVPGELARSDPGAIDITTLLTD